MAKTKSLLKKPKSLGESAVRKNPIKKAKKIASNKTTLSFKKQTKKSKPVGKPRHNLGEKKGVVYLSHIPHGFYEDQIEGYFNQFGKVTAVSVPRSKTGRSKGYAFIEFRHLEVAEIAAETMNNYLMFNRVLKAKCIPPEKQKPMKFQLAESARLNKETLADKAAKNTIKNRKFKNRTLKSEIEARKTAILIWKEKRARNAIKKLGIEYDFEVQRDGVNSVFEKRNGLREKKKERALLENTTASNEEEPASDAEELSSFDGNTSLSDEEDSILSDVEEKSKSNEKLKKKSEVLNISKLIHGQTKETPSSPKNIKNKEKTNFPSFIQMSENRKTPVKTPIQNHQLDQTIKLKQTSNTPITSKTKKENDNPKKVKSKTPQTDGNTLPSSNKTPVLKLLGTPKIAKNTPSTPKFKQMTDLVMEVDENDTEINFKTPPNVLKKFMKGSKQSAKKTTQHKDNSSEDTPNSIGSPGKTLSAKKLNHRKSLSLPQEVKTPSAKTPKTPAQINLSPGESTSSKKPRHRQLKRLSTTK